MEYHLIFQNTNCVFQCFKLLKYVKEIDTYLLSFHVYVWYSYFLNFAISDYGILKTENIYSSLKYED